jgi:hypothetical protein
MGEKNDRLYHCPKCDQDANCMVHSLDGVVCTDCHDAECLAKEGENGSN